MAIIANRHVDLLPGWSFEAGQRVPEKVWNDLGKAKQRVLLSGRFFIPKHGKAAERIPCPSFNASAAAPPVAVVPSAPRKIIVWPEYEKPADKNPSLNELAAIEAGNVASDKQFISVPQGSLTCDECGAQLGSKQALGGHKAGHTRERRRQLQEA